MDIFAIEVYLMIVVTPSFETIPTCFHTLMPISMKFSMLLGEDITFKTHISTSSAEMFYHEYALKILQD